jgi:outer membrane autotransporter protein
MERRDGRNLRHQSAMGLLLLTLLMANPLQGFSQSGVITSGSTTGVVLTNLFGSPTNFVTVNPGLAINNSGGGSNAVFGNTYFWNLTNAATLNGNTNGVYMDAGGSVNNLTNGIITGGNNGVYITGGTNSVVSVVNAGSIRGTNSDGVYMGTNGSVNNLTNGIITGGANGVEITGSGSVVNAGSSNCLIIGTNGDGVYLGGGGSVVNKGTAWWSIRGNENGVEIAGGMGYVTNNDAGIRGTNGSGVYLGGGGSVDNEGDSAIWGVASGVKITGASGSVVNNGSEIVGQTVDGVYLGSGGSVNNLNNGITNGIIAGGTNGVEIAGTGSVVNAGSIIGTNGSGVYMDTGSVSNLTGGIIKGGQYGMEITNGAASVINAGRIIGTNGTAISLGNYSNTVVLQTGSLVQGNIVGGATGTNAAFLQGNGSYGNSFSNFETLTVQADATGWNLTGTNTFSTNTTVQTGLLRINGSLTTPLLTVSNSLGNTNGLGGSGTIIGIVDNHGYFAPGNSIGTNTIIGSLTNWGDYYVQVDAATNSDHIVVSDTATINGGNVIVQPAHEIYGSNTVYTILTATNGISGQYVTNSIVPTFSPYVALFLTSSLSNDLDNVYLTLHRKAFTTVANTYNQHSVAGALDGIVDPARLGNAPAMSNLVAEFFWLPDAGTARAALDSMSGEIHGTLGMLDVQQQDAFNNSIALRTGRISAGGESGGYASNSNDVFYVYNGSGYDSYNSKSLFGDNIWLQGFGSFGHLDGDGNASGGNFTISGLSGGFDYRLRPGMLVGLAVGYSHDNAGVGGLGASGTVSAIQFAGYGGYVNGPWHLDGIFSCGFLKTDTKRFINVGSIHQEADGKYNGDVLSLSTEGGYAFKAGPVTIEPTAGLDYAHLSQDSFNETGTNTFDGNNYGLHVNSVAMDSLRTALGVRLAAQFGKTNGVQFIPALRVAWEHEFADKTADVNASFIGGSGDFVVRGVELGADSGVLGAGLTVSFNKAIQGFVNYDAHLNARMSSHAVSGGLVYSF